MPTSIRSARSLIACAQTAAASGDDKYLRRVMNNLRATIDALHRDWARCRKAAIELDEVSCKSALQQIEHEMAELKSRLAELGDPTLDAAIGGVSRLCREKPLLR